MSLALGLARHGVRSALFERKSEIDPYSRALGVLPRTLEIFRTWGIYERFVSEGVLRTKVDFWIVGQKKPERLPRQHLAIDGSDLMRQRVDHRRMDGE